MMKTATKHQEADKIIRAHVLWSMGAGLMPIPVFDIAAVTAVQIDMLKQLAACHEVDFSHSHGKAFVGGLTGSTFARIAASLVKVVPGIGSVVGGLSMSLMSGASTYAVGQVAKGHFAAGSDLSDIDLRDAKEVYKEEFERGKKVASDLEAEKKASGETHRIAFEAIRKLEELKEKGLVSDAEFEALKEKLLGRL
jgi:uncharacterized protein (DUF697 family)